MFSLFRRSSNKALIDRLHGEIMAGARQPEFFLAYGVADTVEGRFELLCLLATVTLRRIDMLPAPGPEIGQELTDSVFAHFDVALREIGVGDLTVPKKIKKMAQGWLGRGVVYREALAAADESAMSLAIARNVFGDECRASDANVARLSRYAFALDQRFVTLRVEDLGVTALTFTDPASI